MRITILISVLCCLPVCVLQWRPENLADGIHEDYYHRPYYEIIESTLNDQSDFSEIIPYSDNNLINGKMSYYCALALAGTKCT